jgi:hypothetical protein
MNNVISLGFFREADPIRHHRDAIMESIKPISEDYHHGEHAPDLKGSLNHLKQTLKDKLSDEWTHPHVDKVHDIFMKHGVTPGSMEEVHSYIDQNLPNDNHRNEFRKAYSGSQLSMFSNVRDDIDHVKDGKDMSHDEVKALTSVGMTPVMGNKVRSQQTGRTYHYEDGALHLTPESFRVQPGNFNSFKINRDNQRELDQTHKALVQRTGDITPEQKEALDSYTKDSTPFSLYHIHKHKNIPIIKDPIPDATFGENNLANVEKHTPILQKMISEKSGHNHAPLKVFTGISRHTNLDGTDKSLPRNEEGHIVYHAPSFISTSLAENVAHDFLRGRPNHELDHYTHDVVKLEIPPNYAHGAYIAGHSVHKTELEYLLNKGHSIAVDPNKKPTYIGSNGKLVRQFEGKLIPPKSEQ